MAHPLSDSRLKLIRANEHLEAFKSELKGFHARQPYSVIQELDTGTSCVIFRVRVHEHPPPDLGLALGDFVQNARAALDYLAYQLVFLNGKVSHRRTQFPIFTSCTDFLTKGKGMMARMGRAHIDMLEELQPYHALDPHTAPLARLSELSNGDKHRVLTTPLMYVNALGYTIHPVRDIASVDYNNSVSGMWSALEDNAEIDRVPITISGPEPKIQVDRTHAVDVSLGDGLEAVDSLQGIYDEVERIVFDVFMPEFRQMN